MATLISTQRSILKMTGYSKYGILVLIQTRGEYLRQLAGSVINGNLSIEAAAKLFVNY
jgi:hypothetical protein